MRGRRNKEIVKTSDGTYDSGKKAAGDSIGTLPVLITFYETEKSAVVLTA
jgi:hypothetical protein